MGLGLTSFPWDRELVMSFPSVLPVSGLAPAPDSKREHSPLSQWDLWNESSCGGVWAFSRSPVSLPPPTLHFRPGLSRC